MPTHAQGTDAPSPAASESRRRVATPARASLASLAAGGLFAALAGLAAASAAPAKTASAASPTDAAATPGFAVVELFTSEGCSSCPPADDVAADLARRARASSEPVYVLAYHVHYWDNLGWPDRFASVDATNRQRAYATRMNLRSIYTPQMVINGRTEFVGSRKAEAQSHVAAALAAPASATITAAVAQPSPDAFTVTASLAAPAAPEGTPGVRLIAALVEDGLSTNVPRGENAGATLHHDGVVRAFTSAPVAAGAATPATLTLTPPADLVRTNAAVIVYAQRGPAGEIIAATRLPLPAAAPAR